MNLNKEIHIKKIKWPRSLSFYLPLIISRLLFVPAFAGLFAGLALFVGSIYMMTSAYVVPEGGWLSLIGFGLIIYGSISLGAGATLIGVSMLIQHLLIKHNPGFKPKRANTIYGVLSAVVAVCLVIGFYLMRYKEEELALLQLLS